MLKQQYRILKYIYKNPEIKKSALLQKFPDFEKYERSISEFVFQNDSNQDIVEKTRDQLIHEADKKGLSVAQINAYVNNNMPKDIQNITDYSLITYSTNLEFQKFFEKKRHDTLIFWFPYAITTLIAFSSIIIQLIRLYLDYFACK